MEFSAVRIKPKNIATKYKNSNPNVWISMDGTTCNISDLKSQHLLSIVRLFREDDCYTSDEASDIVNYLLEEKLISPELYACLYSDFINKGLNNIIELKISEDERYVFKNYLFDNLVKEVVSRGLEELPPRAQETNY